MLMAGSPRGMSGEVATSSPVASVRARPRKSPRGHVGLTAPDIAKASPRVGPGVPRRPRRPGQVLRVNAAAANSAEGSIQQPLWTLPHQRNRDAINHALYGNSPSAAAYAGVMSPTRPPSLHGSRPSPNTIARRKFFFTTPSPKADGEATSSGYVSRSSGHTSSRNSGATASRVSHASSRHSGSSSAAAARLTGSHINEEGKMDAISPSAPASNASSISNLVVRDADSRPESKTGASSTHSSDSDGFGSGDDTTMAKARRRPRRKGIAARRPVVARLDLRKVEAMRYGANMGASTGGTTSTGDAPHAAMRRRVPHTTKGLGIGRRFSPRAAPPSLGDYTSGGVLVGGAAERRARPRRPTRHTGRKEADDSGGKSHDDNTTDEFKSGGVATVVSAGRTATTVVRRPIRVLANHSASPRSVLERLAARNAGGYRRDASGHSDSKRMMASTHQPSSQPTVGGAIASSGTGLDGRPQSSSGRSRGRPPRPGRGAHASGGDGSARAQQRVTLAPLKLDFSSTTVRPSPLSARRRRGGAAAGAAPSADLPPLVRHGLTRTIRSPTDDHRQGILGPSGKRGMVVRGDTSGAGEVLLSGRRGSAAKLTPLNAAGLTRSGATSGNSSTSSLGIAAEEARKLVRPPSAVELLSSRSLVRKGSAARLQPLANKK